MLSFVGFGFNISLLEFLGVPWWPATLIVWFHETIFFFDVLVDIGLSLLVAMFSWLLLFGEFLFLGFLFLVGCVSCFYGLVHGIFRQGGDGCVFSYVSVVAGLYFHWWLVVDAQVDSTLAKKLFLNISCPLRPMDCGGTFDVRPSMMLSALLYPGAWRCL